MTIKGSWSRVKDHERFAAEHDRIFKRTAESEADHKRSVKIDQLTRNVLKRWPTHGVNTY